MPGCQRSFNHTFDQSHSPKGTFACGFCYIWQPSFFKDYFTCCSRHSVRTLLFNRFIYHFDTDFKSPRSERDFLLEGFFINLVTVATWRIILSSIELFVFPLPFLLDFSTSHIARRIIKLIAWATPF